MFIAVTACQMAQYRWSEPKNHPWLPYAKFRTCSCILGGQYQDIHLCATHPLKYLDHPQHRPEPSNGEVPTLPGISVYEIPPAESLSGSPHPPSGAERAPSSIGLPQGYLSSTSASLVSSASGLVAPSAVSPPSCRIIRTRFRYDHRLVERTLENLVCRPRRPCCCLFLPHLLGFDTYVVYLFLVGVVNLLVPESGPVAKDRRLTSVRQGPGVVIRNPSSPCDCQFFAVSS